MMVYRKDGSPFWSEWHLSPIVGEGGEIKYFVSLFSDMTTFRQAQEDLLQAKKLAEKASAVKTNFLAMMSHEIRTPINGIQGVLKLISETQLDAEQQHFLTIAISSSQALHRIINDILDYAKMEAGKVEIFNEPFLLQNLTQEVMALAGPMLGNREVELGVDLEAGLPPCFVGDSGRIRQILLNLVNNAIKFTEAGSIRVRIVPLLGQDVNGKPGMLVRFEVQDTGIGIAAAEQAKLFKEFSQVDRSYTRRFGGTGLGLAICKRLVVMQGGEIGVESQPGKGSRFWFMLPLQICEESESLSFGQTTNVGQADFSGQAPENFTILLVEDNDTNRLVAGRYLEKAGFKVEEAVNGIQAVDKAKAKDYDLILMDVSMPEMDGMLATCHIRADGGHNAKVPIVALTAHVMAGDRDLCLEVGMNDYLNKPIEYPELLKVLGRWLRLNIAGASSSKIVASPARKEEQESATGDLPDFDSHPLERMKEDLGGNAVRQVTDTFLKDAPSRVQKLTDPSMEIVRDNAHTLKSSSANCGLARFAALMMNLEKAAASRDEILVAELQAKALGVFEAGIDALQKQRDAFMD
jgi:signal transduction histidine kinase/CheY-like chemotaxis protein/HPt (histidine-containing phosphotransfer) domain-containing protein